MANFRIFTAAHGADIQFGTELPVCSVGIYSVYTAKIFPTVVCVSRKQQGCESGIFAWLSVHLDSLLSFSGGGRCKFVSWGTRRLIDLVVFR